MVIDSDSDNEKKKAVGSIIKGISRFPGTPMNGTPFWEASHTIPIPLP